MTHVYTCETSTIMIVKIFIKSFLCLFVIPSLLPLSPPPISRQPMTCFLSQLTSLHFVEIISVESHGLFSFLVWFLSLSIIILRFMHFAVCINSPFLHVFSFLLGKYIGVQLLDCMINSCLSFEETVKIVFQSGCTLLPSHQSAREFQFLHILTSTWCGQSFRF